MIKGTVWNPLILQTKMLMKEIKQKKSLRLYHMLIRLQRRTYLSTCKDQTS